MKRARPPIPTRRLPQCWDSGRGSLKIPETANIGVKKSSDLSAVHEGDEEDGRLLASFLWTGPGASHKPGGGRLTYYLLPTASQMKLRSRKFT